ncbi:FAD/FMN-containing dehydrogenase [Kribbella orskensis]|uniref:FAD/FMN-containing dehydrogenase n=1 Tax=Kribbella orskensis TaxID=2512216 RepID=A0ABY2BSA8_9ACTN|nr:MULTISPECIES: FAD-binding and (Fe-S)-binding domain-containing protein [Kribbella]TCN42856.1 FAD/FMN-containing dehydrogenase [Kribbella sp. VKM Ac-2500]TCO29788.1 FAD/FMN-containing dehydrogenase [Kribbella orskensis]
MSQYDVPRLARELGGQLRGSVGADARSRALYAADGSNYRAVPDLVVVPADREDLAAAVALTAAAGAPVTLRGGGTSMAGNAIGGVIIDASRHVNRILAIEAEAQTAVVEPGVILTHLLAAARPHGLAFGADPSSGSRATLGGMIANNACGAHSVAWGTTADNLVDLDLVLADGTRLTVDAPGAKGREYYAARPGREGELHRALQAFVDRHELLISRRFGQFSRQISGYALHRLLPQHGYDVARLLAGSEGGFAATLQATVRLTPLPAAKVLCVLGFGDSITSADCVPVVLRHGPLTMESINSDLVERLPAEVRDAAVHAGLPAGRAWLLVELGGSDQAAATIAAEKMLEELRDSGSPATASLVTDPRAQGVLWRCRTDAAGLATRRADGAEAWGGWEDAAVPPERLGAYLRGLDELLARHGLSGASYGHFGEGCMHMRIDFDLFSARGLATYRAFVEQATDLVVELGGSVSGEHGDGRARSELLARMYGADGVRLFREVKEIWDPAGVMNPGMIVDPPPLDVNIRHDGPAKDRQLLTVFAYHDDDHDFAQAQRRCVGIGNCRQTAGGVMCPSYQVTREELHSTRGRAHLLWEMLQGDVITDGWRSTEVRDALDLCLSCKGCLSDCPVNVDMATYKAEFTHHHYARRPWARPLSHWSMGWLPVWARLAARAPRLANRLAGLALAKRLGGIAPEREVPEFAQQTFTDWFLARGKHGRGERGKVVLWPDTFTDHLSPQVGRAAVEVLEAAGFEVVLPDKRVCCGLTWISTGQLGVAQRVMKRSLAILAPHLAAGTPIIGLEPSCTAAFRQDAPDLLNDNPLAHAAAKSTFTLAEFLTKSNWKPPQVGGEALVQPHCHQHAVLGFDADKALMAAAGITAVIPDAGCCGLAGNFGFERTHYTVSKAVGERALLPAVRAASNDTTILADGFSCRTQIEQGTDRHPLHLAEILAARLARNASDSEPR